MKTFVGLDRREEWTRLLRGKRIGLITNYSGVDACWRSNVELFLGEGLHLVKLFTPEHGLFGALAGEEVSDTEHEEYHIPVISLYGDRLHPDKEDFEGIDVLVYEIMDVGLRYYTYIYTMTYCMETAASCGLPFVVLDRPNPLGGRIVSGGVMNSRYASFIGDYGLPVRYGLTPGEMGYYYLRWKKIDLDYQVVPLGNYTRDTYFPDTGCLWNIPSPALADYAATVCYAGGCFVGATSLSEGRGSSRPFQMYGAPVVRMGEFCKELERELEEELEKELWKEEVMLRQRAFVPLDRKYVGKVCYGVEFAPLKKDLDFIPIALVLMRTAARLYPEDFNLPEHEKGGKKLDYLAGDSRAARYVEGKSSLRELLEEWKEEAEAFREKTEDIRLYGAEKGL